MQDYGTYGTNSIYTPSPTIATETQARRIASVEESEQTEKTLHHLAGRVQELRARLERVLIPASPVGSGQIDAKLALESGSPLTDRLRTFRRLAQDSIDSIEDILNRLDV